MAGRLDIRRYPGFAAMTVLCLTILYVPLMVVMAYSYNDSTSLTNWGGVSLRWYADLFTGVEAPRFRAAAWNSLTIAALAGTAPLVTFTFPASGSEAPVVGQLRASPLA